MTRSLEVECESWPITGGFRIARGTKHTADVVVVSLVQDGVRGRGECVPYGRYGETAEGVITALNAMAGAIAAGLGRQDLQGEMAPGAARNALDCALWDFEAKQRGVSVTELAGLEAPRALLTATTLSLAAPGEMAAAARARADHRLLKLKLGADGDEDRLAAVRRARPDARLIVDANEGWGPERLTAMFEASAAAGVELIEQPLAAGEDNHLAEIERPCPICADEALDPAGDLERLAGLYDAVNVKLDKAGGLSVALALIERARAADFKIMVGCMVATSLAMAPAVLAAQRADWVDLDGPLLLERDRDHGLVYDGDTVWPPEAALWG